MKNTEETPKVVYACADCGNIVTLSADGSVWRTAGEWVFNPWNCSLQPNGLPKPFHTNIHVYEDPNEPQD